MPKGIVLFCLILGCWLFATLAADPLQQANPAQSQEASSAAKMPTPADGYNVHVLAPHLVDGKQMGPYHHYCKVMAPDPQIVCLIYESTDPNARLAQIEWIYAKKLTRPAVSLKDMEQELARPRGGDRRRTRPGARSAAGQSQRSCRYRCYHRWHDLSLLF